MATRLDEVVGALTTLREEIFAEEKFAFGVSTAELNSADPLLLSLRPYLFCLELVSFVHASKPLKNRLPCRVNFCSHFEKT